MTTKLFFKTLILLFVTVTMFAQSSKREEGIKIGFKGGLNASNFLSSDIEEQSIRTSFHIGFVSEIVISDKASFQPELLFSSQGNVGPETKQKYNYINVPLLVKYNVINNLSIDAGPQLGFLINSYSRGNNGNTDLTKQNFFDVAVGLGTTYTLKNNVFFQGRYNLGLLNVNAADNADVYKYQNSVLQLSVGYYF